MKKKLAPFIAGILCTIFLMSFATTTFASSDLTTIEVGPISIQINGKEFKPKDVNGKNVPVFIYNGTTYAPLRALAEAYGLDVWYDNNTRQACVGPKGSAPNNEDQQPSQITTHGPIRIFRVNEPGVNSAGGVSLSIIWNNFSGKAIKYIRFYVTPYNRVGDVVRCDITGVSTSECYSVGPFDNVSPNMDWSQNPYFTSTEVSGVATAINDDGTFTGYGGAEIQVDEENMYDTFLIQEWLNVWYNYDVAEVRLAKVTIEFMDGTKSTLTGDLLQNCFW